MSDAASETEQAAERAVLDPARYPNAIERFAVTMVAAFEGLPFPQSSTGVRALRASLAELRAAKAEVERMIADRGAVIGQSLDALDAEITAPAGGKKAGGKPASEPDKQEKLV